jgi:hypothetical protein
MKRERYLELIEPALLIVIKKHEDYGDDRLGLHSYFPFGTKSYVQMLHVKTQRLVALTQSEKEPNFESVEDSLKDLLNYTVFMLDWLHGEGSQTK